jgi:hypothetical protein
MGLPALINGPYIFNVNNLFYCGTLTVKCQTAIFQMKEILVSLGGAGSVWSVVASSNATAVKNIGDADPDLWLAYTDIKSGSTHSWVLLENSTTGGQLCLDYSYLWYMNVLYSPGGTFADDGTTSARPTNTDAKEIITSSILWTTSTSTYINCAIHAMMSADHKTTRLFVQERNSTGSEEGGFTILIEEIINTHPYWISTNKTAILYHYTNVSFSATPFYMFPSLGLLQSGTFWAFVETEDPYADWDSFYATCECYAITGATSGIPDAKLNTSLGLLGGFPINPIGCYRPGAVSRGGAIGKFRDIYFAPTDHANLSAYPGDASRQWAKIGALFVPWNGTEPLKV